MSTLTRNRIVMHLQGANITAANTTYPADIVTDPNIHNVAVAANSTANGVAMPVRYCNTEVVINTIVTAADPPTVAVAVYGYVRHYLNAAKSAFVDNDSSTTRLEPWKHLITLNSGQVISTTTQQVNGTVNVNAPDANSIDYTEVISVGAMYERIRCIPVVLTGTTPVCNFLIGFAGGQR